MPGVTSISILANSLNAAVKIAKAMVDHHNWSVVQTKVIEFQQAILDAQSSIFAVNEERSALIERVRQLEEEVADLKAWQADKQNYELDEIDVGAFAYSLKPSVQTTEPRHWLCATCYNRGKKSLLQFDQVDKQAHIYKCHECPGTIRVNWNVSPSIDKADRIRS